MVIYAEHRIGHAIVRNHYQCAVCILVVNISAIRKVALFCTHRLDSVRVAYLVEIFELLEALGLLTIERHPVLIHRGPILDVSGILSPGSQG